MSEVIENARVRDQAALRERRERQRARAERLELLDAYDTWIAGLSKQEIQKHLPSVLYNMSVSSAPVRMELQSAFIKTQVSGLSEKHRDAEVQRLEKLLSENGEEKTATR